MTKPTLYFLFLCSAAASFAQNPFFERNFQSNFYNQIAEMRSGADGNIYLPVIGNLSDGANPLSLIHIDGSGVSESFVMFNYGKVLGYDFIPLDDGYIALGSFFQCDIVIPWSLYRYDATGTLLWQTTVFDEYPDIYEVKMMPGPDGTIWLLAPGEPALQIDTDDGQFVAYGPFLPFFNSYLQLSDNKLITYGSDGLGRYNTTLTSLHFELPGIHVLKADTLGDGRIIALDNTQLFRFDHNLNLEKMENHGIPADQIADMDADSDQIWILTKGPAATLLKFNSNLQQVDILALPDNEPFHPRFLHRSGNRMLMAGEEWSSSQQAVAVRSMPADSLSFNATTDATVVAISSPNLPLGYAVPSPNPGYSIVFKDVFITVKNEGNAPLESVSLNCVMSSYQYFCGLEEDRYQHHFTGLSIAPGDSLQISIGNLFWEEPNVSLPSTVTLCFRTTLPNDSLDRNPQNNSFCQTFGVLVPVIEPAPVVQGLEIFPNPASGDCTIHIPGDSNEDAVLRLFDGTGRLVKTESFSDSSLLLHRKNTPPGMYNVLITKSDGHTFAGKVVFN